MPACMFHINHQMRIGSMERQPIQLPVTLLMTFINIVNLTDHYCCTWKGSLVTLFFVKCMEGRFRVDELGLVKVLRGK